MTTRRGHEANTPATAPSHRKKQQDADVFTLFLKTARTQEGQCASQMNSTWARWTGDTRTTGLGPRRAKIQGPGEINIMEEGPYVP